jgi:uncharacterized delta-60 repeat protein
MRTSPTVPRRAFSLGFPVHLLSAARADPIGARRLLLATILWVAAAGLAHGQAGSLDPSFDGRGFVTTSFGNLFDVARDAVAQPDGKILVAGWTRQSVNADLTFGDHDFAIARYNPNGTLDLGFADGGRLTDDFGGTSDTAERIVLQPDGKIIAIGTITPRTGGGMIAVARYLANGSPDGGFGDNGVAVLDVGGFEGVTAAALQPDGKIVVAGVFAVGDVSFPINTLDFLLVRFDASGNRDTDFSVDGLVITDVLGVQGPDRLTGLVLLPDGKILVVGVSDTYDPLTGSSGGEQHRVMVRYDPNGNRDLGFGTAGVVITAERGSGRTVLEPNGKVLVGGGSGVARYNDDGTLAAAFINPYDMSSSRIALQPDGRVVAAGNADPIGTDSGGDDFGLVRINADLTLDLSFGTNGFVTTDLTGPDDRDEPQVVLVQPDGKIVVAGNAGGGFGVARYFGLVPPLGGDDAWLSSDVGAVSATGSAFFDGVTATVTGSGADIWGTADEFHYLSRAVTGDFEFTARVASVQNVNQWTKAGLMMRTDTSPGAVHASVLATPSSAKGIAFQRRVTNGGTTVHTSGPSVAPPVWLRLTRAGSTVTASSRSSAIAPWITIGSQAFASLPADVRLGLAVSSHVDGQLATAVLDNLTIVQRDSGTNVAPMVSLTAPTDGATLLAPALVTMRANATDPDDGVSRVEFQLESATGWSTLDEDPTAPYEGQAHLNVSGTYRLRARAVDVAGAAALSAVVSVTVVDSTAWQRSDVGAVGAAGGATVGDTTATVTGSGADIWGTSDELHFAHRTMSGDFEITARVASVENVNAWTKAGLMIREHLGAGARHASLFATPTAVKGLAFQRRTTENGASVHTAGPPLAPDVWLKLTRRGDRISAYFRKNTTDFWAAIGSQDLQALSSAVDVGLAVSSHVDGALATATFSDVHVTPLPLWNSGASIGLNAGAVTHDGASFSLDSKGADIWGTADAFQAVFTAMSGDGSITARVKSIQRTHDWAKAGVMIRETLAPGSTHAFGLVSAAKGVGLQYRATINGVSVSGGGTAGTAPQWVRLQRAGSVFTMSGSSDGVVWTTLGTATIVMGKDVYAGLAVTSHDSGRTALGLFDDVVVDP